MVILINLHLFIGWKISFGMILGLLLDLRSLWQVQRDGLGRTKERISVVTNALSS
jgi:hypothetical protein